jgi:DNA-binding IclR family transcriptional regulator
LLRNTFAILRLLGRLQSPVGVSSIAAQLGLPKTTVHRLLEQLADEDVVVRRDGRWVLGSGLVELDRRVADVSTVVTPRMTAMTQATGATLFLYTASDTSISLVARSHGPAMGRIMPAAHQAADAVDPSSAIYQAVRSGEFCAEFGEVHPNCCGIATPFFLPSGRRAALGLALPQRRAVEALKRPLEQLATSIAADVNRLPPR